MLTLDRSDNGIVWLDGARVGSFTGSTFAHWSPSARLAGTVLTQGLEADTQATSARLVTPVFDASFTPVWLTHSAVLGADFHSVGGCLVSFREGRVEVSTMPPLVSATECGRADADAVRATLESVRAMDTAARVAFFRERA